MNIIAYALSWTVIISLNACVAFAVIGMLVIITTCFEYELCYKIKTQVSKILKWLKGHVCLIV